MGRTGMMHKFGMCAVILLSMGFALGGCKADQKRAAAAQAEAQEYREKVATLEQANRDKDSRIADLESRLSSMQQTQQAAPASTPGFGSDAPMGGGTASREFSNDSQGRPRALLSGDILFDSGRATLKPSARQRLDTLSNEIKRNYAGRMVLVEGHTDTDPIRKSSFGSNQALSEARAQAVRQYLIQKGISASRIEAVGFGSSNPRSTKAASRRVEIVITN
jgi:chemotaxis protein MotB